MFGAQGKKTKKAKIKKEVINKNDVKQTSKSSAPVDQDGFQTAEEHRSKLPKGTDIPDIDGKLARNKYGSRVPKIHNKLKATYQGKRE